MIIRQAQECDWKELSELLNNTFNTLYGSDFDKFSKWLMVPNQYTFVGIMDNKIVATQTITIEHKLIHNYGLVAHSEDLAVSIRYRNQGLAKKMMDYCIEVCKEKGVST